MIHKKGVSTIVTTVILMAIVIVLAGMLFYVIIPMINENIAHTKACSPEIIGKANLNQLYTCYDGKAKKMKVSVEIGDLKYDKILVYIGTGGNSEKKEIIGQDKNSGKVYEYENIATKPDTIKLIPVIDGEQCDVIDSINEVATCP